jgi:hypothetical protein
MNKATFEPVQLCGVRRRLVLDFSDFELFTPVLNNDLFVVLLGDAAASPASNDFDLVAQSSA